jgi:hypothetical protein
MPIQEKTSRKHSAKADPKPSEEIASGANAITSFFGNSNQDAA